MRYPLEVNRGKRSLSVGRRNACRKADLEHGSLMVRLADIQKQADTLHHENRAGLFAHLLHQFDGAPEDPTDQEVSAINHDLVAG